MRMLMTILLVANYALAVFGLVGYRTDILIWGIGNACLCSVFCSTSRN